MGRDTNQQKFLDAVAAALSSSGATARPRPWVAGERRMEMRADVGGRRAVITMTPARADLTLREDVGKILADAGLTVRSEGGGLYVTDEAGATFFVAVGEAPRLPHEGSAMTAIGVERQR